MHVWILSIDDNLYLQNNIVETSWLANDRNVHMSFDETSTEGRIFPPNSESLNRFLHPCWHSFSRAWKSFDRTHALIRKWYDLLSPIKSTFVSSNENERIERKKRGKIDKRRGEEEKNSIAILQVYSYSVVEIFSFFFSLHFRTQKRSNEHRFEMIILSRWHRNNYTNLIVE